MWHLPHSAFTRVKNLDLKILNMDEVSCDLWETMVSMTSHKLINYGKLHYFLKWKIVKMINMSKLYLLAKKAFKNTGSILRYVYMHSKQECIALIFFKIKCLTGPISELLACFCRRGHFIGVGGTTFLSHNLCEVMADYGRRFTTQCRGGGLGVLSE